VPDVFTAAAVKKIAQISGGNPRAINGICDRALTEAVRKDLATVGPTLVGPISDGRMADSSRPGAPRTLALPVTPRRGGRGRVRARSSKRWAWERVLLVGLGAIVAVALPVAEIAHQLWPDTAVSILTPSVTPEPPATPQPAPAPASAAV